MKEKLKTYAPIVGIIIAAVLLAKFDNTPKGYTNFYDKNLSKHPPSCLALSLIPEEKKLTLILKDMYPFQSNCPYRLSVTSKENIHCNSNQNSDRKALSAFPTSFIRMEIRQGMRLLYSYYVDLPKPPKKSEITAAFSKISKDIGLDK